MNLGKLLPWRRKNASLELFQSVIGSNIGKSGASVTWHEAIRVAAVFACTRVIAQGVAQVPLKLFQDVGGNKRAAYEHPLYFLLHNKPNEWQTSFSYRETMVMHLVLAGSHYAFKNVVLGKLVELIPFEPGVVMPKRSADGEITYTVAMANGAEREFPAEAIWHVRGPSWNGWHGMDPIRLAREAIGLSISAEAAQAKFFANGVRPAGAYSVDGPLNGDQYKALREFIVRNNSGENEGLPMILDRGAKWLQLSLSGADAQHLETRRFQIEEVCRAMGVMPIMIGHADKTATYASAEQMFLAHVVHCLMPWYTRIEQSIDAHLIGRKDVERGYYAKFIVGGLLRGAMKDRGDYYAKALGAGGSPAWMTQDEVRALEEYNPMGGAAAALPAATNLPQPPGDKNDGTS